MNIRSFADRQETICNIAEAPLAYDVLTFGQFLDAQLARVRMDQQTFADLAGLSKQLVSDLVNDRRRPNPERAEKWADIIGLRGEGRERFLDLAVIGKLPASARPRLLRLLEKIDQYESAEGAADGAQ